jgi:hypothetical protein
MNVAQAFPGLAKRCRWRASAVANGRCRFDQDDPKAPCSLSDCPAVALGIVAACVLPELPRGKDLATVAKKKGKKQQGPLDPLRMAIDVVAGLTGFNPQAEDEDDER